MYFQVAEVKGQIKRKYKRSDVFLTGKYLRINVFLKYEKTVTNM